MRFIVFVRFIKVRTIDKAKPLVKEGRKAAGLQKRRWPSYRRMNSSGMLGLFIVRNDSIIPSFCRGVRIPPLKNENSRAKTVTPVQ